jgi:hypothetical protein
MSVVVEDGGRKCQRHLTQDEDKNGYIAAAVKSGKPLM